MARKPAVQRRIETTTVYGKGFEGEQPIDLEVTYRGNIDDEKAMKKARRDNANFIAQSVAHNVEVYAMPLEQFIQQAKIIETQDI